MTDKEVIELVKSIRNRCEILLLLDASQDAIGGERPLTKYWATLLEGIAEDSQALLEFCIVDKEVEK